MSYIPIYSSCSMESSEQQNLQGTAAERQPRRETYKPRRDNNPSNNRRAPPRNRSSQDWRDYNQPNVVSLDAQEVRKPRQYGDRRPANYQDRRNERQGERGRKLSRKKTRHGSPHFSADDDLYQPRRTRRKVTKTSTTESERHQGVLYTDDDRAPLPSLLARYNDVPHYADGAHHPRDFDYHAYDSCGPKGEHGLEDAFKNNGIHCEFADYSKFSPDFRASRRDLERLTRARKKACRCEVERRLTNEYLTGVGKQVDGDHIWPLNKAALYCKQCAQMERELYKYGYLKNKTEIEKYDAVTHLLTLVHELLEGPEEVYAAFPGETSTTKMDKLARHVWDNILPRDIVLKNIKKQMPFTSFKSAVSTVQNFLSEKQLTMTIRRMQKQKSRKRTRMKTVRRRLSNYANKDKLIRGLKSVAKRRASRKR